MQTELSPVGRGMSWSHTVPRHRPTPHTFRFLQAPVRSRLEDLLENGDPLVLFWISVTGHSLFARLYGGEAGEAIAQQLGSILAELLPEVLPPDAACHLETVDNHSYLVLLEGRGLFMQHALDLALALKLRTRNQLNQEVVRLTGQSLGVEVGPALVESHPGHDLESLIFTALGDARQAAERSLDARGLGLMTEFRRVIEEPLLHAVYQPIVNLADGEVLGWEALARGPRDSHFTSPKILFDFAEEVGSIFQLERVCRERAVSGLGGLAPGQKLFLNIHPHTLGDPQFKSGETLELLDRHGLRPSNVVFEITERHSIRDFTLFDRTLEHYRAQGYLVAIDDVGTGYSGLSRLARVRPDYIKVDMSLVQGIDYNPVQRALLETLVTFANKIGSAIVAEGIETPTELSSLMAMGVHFGQGFHLARPDRPKPRPGRELPFRLPSPQKDQALRSRSLAVRELAEAAAQVGPGAKVRQVKGLLDNHPISGVVVVEDQRPVGLVMSHSLDRTLGTYFGTALYYERPVERVMDDAPLIVDGSTPVEQVAALATSRDRFKIYDHIIVTEDNIFTGIVSVQKMLDALARMQVEVAKGASPLTGLPGGLSLETETSRRCQGSDPVSFIYVDLDHFKIYNDTYGFEQGDRMIILLADILRWALGRHGDEGSFLGHVGGDDFVVITQPARAERLCTSVVRLFTRLAPRLYRAPDLARGYVEGQDREGRKGRFPLCSVSLGIVDCQGRCELSEVGRRAAEVKRYAKSRPGSVWVRDRRAPLGPVESGEENLACGVG
ncbi:MAG: GGDEF domain-containing protein [Deltaproteobacteria bacterium]|nr:GGDEF domain-containing protein [Deltaproteobacteria bacterium]